MKTAKEFLEERWGANPSTSLILILNDFAREAIKADRENVAEHAEIDYCGPDFDTPFIDTYSIINAPQIELK